MSRTISRAALLASVASLAATCAWAQAAPQGEPTELDEIVVTGRYGAGTVVTGAKIETPLIEVPQSVGVVTEELLDERRPTSLNEALYNVSGVSDGGSRRAFDNLIIRGFTASTSVYLDGLRVERGNFNVPQEVFGLERLEVLKGPGSVLFGQGSLGGIINQVSKRPTGDAAFYAEATAGSFGYWQGAVDADIPLTEDGRWALRVVGLQRNSSDSIDFNDRRRTYIAPSLAWDGGATRFTLIGNVTKDRNEGTYVGIPLEGSLLPNPNGEIDRSLYIGEPGQDLVDVERYTIGFELEHDFGNGWSARQNLRYSDTDVVSSATFSAGLNPDLRTLRRNSARFAQVEDSTAIDTQLQHRFTGGPFENTFLLGADLLLQSVDQSFVFSSFPTLDIFNPVYGGPRGPAFPVLDFTQDDTLWGFYAQNQLRLWDRVTMLLGVRYDATETQRFNRLTSVDRTQEDEDFTFRVGVTYEVADGVALFASYSEAFNPNFGLDAFGDPFDPETGVQYEAGVKTDLFDGRVRSTFSVYELTRENVLVAFPAFPGTQIQTGEQQSRGVEADVAWDVSDQWSLTAAYAYTDVEVVEDTNPALIGDRPSNVPEHQASLWSTYEIPLGDGLLTLGGGGRYVGEREGILPNSFQIPSYTVADALVSYRWDRWRLQANAYNLFDEDHFVSGSPTGTRSIMVGEPLTVRVALGFQL